jgi:superfamily I DNA and/or RNA helicase
LHPNLFDLLIVDEATQCDIATALPAFFRCKRAVVTGDYQQLRHISFLSRQLEQHTFQQTGLPADTFEKWSYRDNSLLDLVNAQIKDSNAITFLDEHFRSRPELIAFSNQHFYNNRIKVMKERPVSPESMAEKPPALILERIEGARSSTNVNQAEVERTLELIQAHIHTYQNADTKPSIGILSPFRAQVDAIRQHLMREISADNILAFKILVGTPYGFQGEERDLMILSFTLDNESRRASYYLNRPDVFNVTVTRAREQQIVLFSGDENTLPPDNLLRLYLESIQSGYALQQPDATPHTEFQQQVCNALEIHGISIWKNFFIAGQVVDLICQKGERMLAIDLIGYPGPGEDYLGVERYQILARAGLEMLPLSYGIWTVDRQAAIDAILERLA